jgi:hypothetical protein
MDDQLNRVSEPRHELIAVASGMLAGGINLIEGIRRICALRFAIEDPDNKVFLPIRAMESETESFSLGEMRAHCSEDYLKRVDAELESYLADARDDILQACREIVRTFS